MNTNLEIMRTQHEFQLSQARDHAQLTDLLHTMMANREDLNAISRLQEPLVEQIMSDVQEELHRDRSMSRRTEQEEHALKSGLAQLREQTGTLPPLPNLTGEVTKLGDVPVAIGGNADIWLGDWLGERVALKILRNIGQMDERTERVRVPSSLHPEATQEVRRC